MAYETEVEVEDEFQDADVRRLARRWSEAEQEPLAIQEPEVVPEPRGGGAWWAQYPDSEPQYTTVLDRRPEGVLVASATGSELVTFFSGASDIPEDQWENFSHELWWKGLSPAQKQSIREAYSRHGFPSEPWM